MIIQLFCCIEAYQKSQLRRPYKISRVFSYSSTDALGFSEFVWDSRIWDSDILSSDLEPSFWSWCAERGRGRGEERGGGRVGVGGDTREPFRDFPDWFNHVCESHHWFDCNPKSLLRYQSRLVVVIMLVIIRQSLSSGSSTRSGHLTEWALNLIYFKYAVHLFFFIILLIHSFSHSLSHSFSHSFSSLYLLRYCRVNDMIILTLFSSSLAASRCVSMASQSIFGRAVSIL